jgi:glycopeptide antibiotics resistance protein
MAWGLLVSLLIELAQLALNVAGLSYRVVDIDDLLLNVAGVAVGRLLFALGWPIWRAVQGPREPR